MKAAGSAIQNRPVQKELVMNIGLSGLFPGWCGWCGWACERPYYAGFWEEGEVFFAKSDVEMTFHVESRHAWHYGMYSKYMLTEEEIVHSDWSFRNSHWNWLHEGVIVEGAMTHYAPCSFHMGEYENGEYKGRYFNAGADLRP